MVKISDIRSDNSKQLKDIELGGFFFFDDILYRKIWTDLDIRTPNIENDGILAMQIATGEVIALNRLGWVEQIADRQVFVEISD